MVNGQAHIVPEKGRNRLIADTAKGCGIRNPFVVASLRLELRTS